MSDRPYYCPILACRKPAKDLRRLRTHLRTKHTRGQLVRQLAEDAGDNRASAAIFDEITADGPPVDPGGHVSGVRLADRCSLGWRTMTPDFTCPTAEFRGGGHTCNRFGEHETHTCNCGSTGPAMIQFPPVVGMRSDLLIADDPVPEASLHAHRAAPLAPEILDPHTSFTVEPVEGASPLEHTGTGQYRVSLPAKPEHTPSCHSHRVGMAAACNCTVGPVRA